MNNDTHDDITGRDVIGAVCWLASRAALIVASLALLWKLVRHLV